jgi:serine/threonine-protein kinase
MHPSGGELEATHHQLGAHRVHELLATRGDAGLWLAEDDDGGATLLRLYPALPTMEQWQALDRAASQRARVVDPRLIPIDEIALDIWPHVSFACAGVESLARRIAREPMPPEAAVAVCADVVAALAALARAGVLPVDVSPADVVLVGERAQLLADVGLPGGAHAHACVDRAHLAPERAAAIADRRRGVRAALRLAAGPTAESMTYALASIVSAAIHRPQGGVSRAPTAASARLEPVLRCGLAQRPSERYRTPAALVEALGGAIGARLPRSAASAPRATRSRGGRAAVARRRTRPGRRSTGIAIPAAVLLAAAAIGTVAGSATTAPDPPPTVTLAGAGLSVEAPPGWSRGGAAEGPPALGAPALVAHAPGQSNVPALAVTRTAAPLLAQLADAVPEAVRLGDYGAWRYREVAVGAGSVADVYVLEDGDGPVVAACIGPSNAPASAREGCSAALTTLRLQVGRVAALGGDAATRRELAGIVEDLNQARTRERRALAVAATRGRQAAAADRLAAAYARAATGAGRLRAVGAPGDLPRLVERLEETGRAYAALAKAARTARRASYAHAGERVVAHERALHADLAALAPARSSR